MIHKNPIYKPAAATTARYRVIYGGAGSGKSVFIAQDELTHAAQDGQRILVVRKVARTLRHSCFQLFLDIITSAGRSHMVRVNKAEMRIDFPASGGALIHVGLDDPEKVKSIAGIDRIWIEEATELTKEDFQLVDLRLRGESEYRKQLTISFNPIRSWIRGYLVDREDEDSPHEEDVFVQLTTYKDNKYVDDGYERVLQSLPEDLKMVYARGEWGVDVRGLIYTNWKTFKLPIDNVTCYGLDFGFNAPSALTAVQVDDPVIKVQEILYEAHLTNQDLINRMDELGISKTAPIYCDNAEPARIEELVRAGYQAYSADKSVNDGIDTVKRYTLSLHANSQNLMNEIREYKWDEDKKTGESIDKPLKRNDHAMDAMRYAIHSHCAEIIGTWGMWK